MISRSAATAHVIPSVNSAGEFVFDLCPTVFDLYGGVIFAHVITMGFVLIKGQVLRISRVSLVFSKNTKEILGIIFIFIKKTRPKIVFLLSKDILGLFVKNKKIPCLSLVFFFKY
jgi:hypothetical protein